jgi:hypothetical protein
MAGISCASSKLRRASGDSLQAAEARLAAADARDAQQIADLVAERVMTGKAVMHIGVVPRGRRLCSPIRVNAGGALHPAHE